MASSSSQLSPRGAFLMLTPLFLAVGLPAEGIGILIAVDTIPDQLRNRTLAVRGFDAGGMMTGWELVEGAQVEGAIEKLFTDPRAAYLHVHFAAPGCYAARVERA